ncbi:MAG: hypothetical protein FWE52_03480 [Alphaproteobacteria bacterium]|nr:hypothetical protein [Alphaproteobacteria bacterium]
MAFDKQDLILVTNDDDNKITRYKLARIIYAETGASSLAAVEALASMIKNLAAASGREFSDIANDSNIFESLQRNNPHKELIYVDSRSNKFQMCLRSVRRMMCGQLMDSVGGATRFHHADDIPDWSMGIGYIADVDGLLFYLEDNV